VHEVIPIFDIISRTIDENMANLTLPPAVCVAATRGRKMLDKYYGLTDNTIVYRIAMCTSLSLVCKHIQLMYSHYAVLHPRYNALYFSKAGWPRDWILVAEKILQNEWNSNYKLTVTPRDNISVVVSFFWLINAVYVTYFTVTFLHRPCRTINTLTVSMRSTMRLSVM
jgi:hypothetical protein